MSIGEFDLGVEPSSDGVDHIRIHPSGKTILGRLLSRTSHCPFKHSEHGSFESMEAFWQWMRSGMQHDELRSVYGRNVQGMRHLTVRMPDKQFKAIILEGLNAWLEQNAEVQELLALSKLPLIEYDRVEKDVYEINHKHDWYLKAIMTARKTLTDAKRSTKRRARQLGHAR